MIGDCPAPKCEADVPFYRFACRRHWYALPKDLRDEINQAWAERQARVPGATEAHETAKAKGEAFLSGAVK